MDTTDTLTDKWIEIFRISKEGRWNIQELEKIVENFSTDPVPVTIAHDVSNLEEEYAIYGWVSELKIVGQSLYCKVKDLEASFLALFNHGQIPGRAILTGIDDRGPVLARLIFF